MSGNKNVVLIMGSPNTGKSASLRNMDQTSMVYLNTDLKELPMADRFLKSVEISNAVNVLDFIQQIESAPQVSGAVLDTLTFLMSMYERQYVNTATNTQKAWGDYGTFYRDLIHAIKAGSKDYVILAHADTQLNEQSMMMETKVPVKGSVGKTGVEADFTTILTAKQMPVKVLEEFEEGNELLTITDDEREDGVKYVFQTRVDKATAGEKSRAAMGLWSRKEKFIDNDIDLVFKRLREYYGTNEQKVA